MRRLGYAMTIAIGLALFAAISVFAQLWIDGTFRDPFSVPRYK